MQQQYCIKNITKTTPINTAFYEPITRKTAALLLIRFASNVLHIQPQSATQCVFSDIGWINNTEQAEIKNACTMGILKWSQDKFWPDNALTRWQLITVVARLISRQSTMEKNDAYDYLLHIGIVTVDDRWESETPSLRKDLYIMLHRIIVSLSQIAALSQFSAII